MSAAGSACVIASDQDGPDRGATTMRAVIRKALARISDGRIVLEPGRYLVAEAGMLLTRVIRVKQGESRAFLIVDAAMNDLLRPSLYDAWHDIVPAAFDSVAAGATL